ncbi:DUF1987 domain-containing protein [Roseibium alexandrii]|uniref:SiaC family regulatory phosphoprotein domain-containing protein n=2 Tax=Roseibium alexandrii TaxID=388408 RepID=A0A0M6ZYP2_9HYPH|nr:DUF1987 domain-containing protein [Roseibium alexandrii]EEE45266.1 protein of unknown function (DUF1987) [Roseibium alexandrii DFL-11]CTQ66644.1 hypothetical protein LAX5112_01042 [Roseibium alexandrii]
MTDTSLKIEATSRSPEVHLDAANGTLSMSGESYPEDASAFFGPVFQAVAEHVAASDGQALTVEMRFIYFNSSSAKAIMNLFQMLEEAAEDGKTITINWYFDPEDDMMEEMGEDFAEDFEHATFNLKPETEDA